MYSVRQPRGINAMKKIAANYSGKKHLSNLSDEVPSVFKPI